MQRHLTTDQPLDEIAAMARSGDEAAEAAFFESLRVRFLVIAKRRVRMDDLEDVVQDSLQIIHAKYRETDPQTRVLTWAMVVLRNVIGNYYQKRKRLDSAEPFEDQIHSEMPGVDTAEHGPAASSDFDATTRRILEAISLLARQHPRCGKLFRSILEQIEEGAAARGIPSHAIDRMLHELGDISRDTLYVVLHRCRRRLGDIMRDLDEPGIQPGVERR